MSEDHVPQEGDTQPAEAPTEQTRDERRAERRSRRRKRLIVIVVLVALGCCGIYGITRAFEPEPLTLMRERCTECHSLGRALSGERDQEGWESVVFRMQGYGAELTNEERDVIVEWLAERSGY